MSNDSDKKEDVIETEKISGKNSRGRREPDSEVLEINVGKYLKVFKGNPWRVSTIVLVLVVVVFVVRGMTGPSGGVSGAVVSENAAVKNLLAFINAQGRGEAKLVSVEKEGALYSVIVDYQGQQIPVYVTLDGKYLITDPIPLAALGGNAGGSAGGSGGSGRGQAGQQPAQPVELPKSDKPIVELFVMSHCPFGTQMEKGILPVAGLLKDKIDFKVKFVYYAMHGEAEVREQLAQYCIQKGQKEKYLAYLKCFLTDGNSTRCLKEAGVNEGALKECITGADTQFSVTKNLQDKASWLSGQFPRFDTDKADNEKYGVAGSPTFVINGKQAQSGRDSVSLLNAICNAFNQKPEECSTQLDATAPGPGFGWDSAGTTNLANCGV